MRTITEQKLKVILNKHQKWLKGEEGGERADLSYCDLCRVSLNNAKLDYAKLDYAVLDGAKLNYASLDFAVLKHTRLCCASLYRASLYHAKLDFAVLDRARLDYARLDGARLDGALLSYAVLKGASLDSATLKRASLAGTVLNGAKNIPVIPLACPSDGAFIGWKSVDKYIVKLQIPAEAKRSSATTSKCRCEYAEVLAIENYDGTTADVDSITNKRGTTYKVGETVYPDSYDENRWNECSHGIHFFVNRQEAVNYI